MLQDVAPRDRIVTSETLRHGPALQCAPTFFVDGVRLWIGREHPADTTRDLRKRASRLRKVAKRLGLAPSALFPARHDPQPWGAGFNVSLAPLWRVPLDLAARASGHEPVDLAAFLRAAEKAGARVTGVEVAIDFLSVDAQLARRLAFPSIDAPHVDAREDLLCLRGRTRRAGRTLRGGTAYARAAGAARNLAIYSDRPSALAPSGPPVLHAEIRLRGAHLPRELREPDGLRHLLTLAGQPLKLAALYAQHVEVRDRTPGRTSPRCAS